MIHVAYFDTAGRITSVGSGRSEVFGDMPWCVKITAAQLSTIAHTHRVDVSTKTLKKGMIANPSPPSWGEIRTQRDFLLRATGLNLSEYMLPDSYPKLPAIQKKAKKDALLVYRQALRDITKQPDPHNITWPPLPK